MIFYLLNGTRDERECDDASGGGKNKNKNVSPLTGVEKHPLLVTFN
jgi:hypothetical protein